MILLTYASRVASTLLTAFELTTLLALFKCSASVLWSILPIALSSFFWETTRSIRVDGSRVFVLKQDRNFDYRTQRLNAS